MPRLKAANNAETTLAAGITSTDTSLTVVDSSLFPDPPFRITIDAEIIEVGAIDRVNHIFSSLQRGLEGTVAAAHSAGASVQNRFTAGTHAELFDDSTSLTVDQAVVPTGSTGVIRDLLSGLANRIKAITGKTNWYDTPDITLATLAAHKTRHATGGADALAPADIGAAAQADLAAHLADNAAHDATSANTANRIVLRDASGNFSAGTITANLNGNASSATNADKVDNIHFQVVSGVLQYDDGTGWKSVSAVKSIQRGVVENNTSGDTNITINSVDVNKAVVITSGDGVLCGNFLASRYAVLTDSTTLTIKKRLYKDNTWINDSVVSLAWQVVEFY